MRGHTYTHVKNSKTKGRNKEHVVMCLPFGSSPKPNTEPVLKYSVIPKGLSVVSLGLEVSESNNHNHRGL